MLMLIALYLVFVDLQKRRGLLFGQLRFSIFTRHVSRFLVSVFFFFLSGVTNRRGPFLFDNDVDDDNNHDYDESS